MGILFCFLMATPFEEGSQALLAGEWQGAVEAFTESIEAKPTAKAHVNRGIAYGRLGKFREAFDDYNAAIKLNPKQAEAYYNRGRLYQKAKRPDKAIADFTKAITIKPTAVAYAERGTVQHGEKRYAEARDDYLAALKLNSNDPTALNNLAWMEATCLDAKFRDGKSAVEHATKVCQLTQFKVPSYASTLAAAYAECGEFQRAVAIAEKISDKYLETYRAEKPVRDK